MSKPGEDYSVSETQSNAIRSFSAGYAPKLQSGTAYDMCVLVPTNNHPTIDGG